MSNRLERSIAVLNGLFGNYLAEHNNGLGTPMGFYADGRPLEPTAAGIRRVHPVTTSRVAVLVHGLMVDESCFRFPDGSDYGSKLRDDLGITPFYLRYNSGVAVADNGAQLSRLLADLVSAYPGPIEELILIGYSMGGLLVRSACHEASESQRPWLSLVRRAIYLGTPHLGAPYERAGRIVARILRSIPDPTTRLIGEISDLRSAGIRDLGDADLRHRDREASAARLSLRDARHPIPLLPGIRHGLIAGSLAMSSRVAALFGDAVVPLGSATGQSLAGAEALSIDQVRVLPGRNHMDLSHDEEAYAQLRTWCETEPTK